MIYCNIPQAVHVVFFQLAEDKNRTLSLRRTAGRLADLLEQEVEDRSLNLSTKTSKRVSRRCILEAPDMNNKMLRRRYLSGRHDSRYLLIKMFFINKTVYRKPSSIGERDISNLSLLWVKIRVSVFFRRDRFGL
jgi:hypothetical protein